MKENKIKTISVATVIVLSIMCGFKYRDLRQNQEIERLYWEELTREHHLIHEAERNIARCELVLELQKMERKLAELIKKGL